LVKTAKNLLLLGEDLLLAEDHEGRVKTCDYLKTMKDLLLSGEDYERSPCYLVRIKKSPGC
jgi:hypothetical protein